MNGLTAKDYLKQIKKIDTQIKNKTVEIAAIKEVGAALTGSVYADIERLYRARAEIIETIEQLPEADYDVLHKIYVQYKTLYEVASDRDISYSLATTIHGRALKRLENIINKE